MRRGSASSRRLPRAYASGLRIAVRPSRSTHQLRNQRLGIAQEEILEAPDMTAAGASTSAATLSLLRYTPAFCLHKTRRPCGVGHSVERRNSVVVCLGASG